MAHSPPPSIDDPVEAATAISEKLRSGVAESERLRHLAPDTARALADAGMWRVLAPAAHGGSEAGLRCQVDTLIVLSAAASAAGWVQMVSNAHAWMVGSFPGQCQAEVFADGPDRCIPGTLASQGKATRMNGGWRLDGRWQFASGVDHGDWLLIGAIADKLPDSPSKLLHLMVPKEDVVVDDTWHSLGLRGTGSKDLIAEEVFVPEHRAIPTRLLFDGLSPHGEGGATFVNRLTVLVCLGVQLAATVVGMAQGALALHVERTAARREVYTGASKAENVGAQMRVAESSTEIHLAGALVREAADRCDEVGESGDRLTLDDRARLKWHASYAVELARRATERIFASAGAHGIYNTSELQARYRDINTACHHAAVDFDGSAQMFGRTQLGLDPGTPLV